MNSPHAEELVLLASCPAAPVALIGRKAHSLGTLAAAGFAVPPAFVLTTRFFQPWFQALEQLPSWSALHGSAPQRQRSLCDELAASAAALAFSPSQELALAELARHMGSGPPGQRFAVRSSSPEEDTASASFAGLYATELGVGAAELRDAIRRCFAACLAHRVMAYKVARGFGLDNPRLAVIVQEQIDSDVAGVAFSLNPANNDFDEAVIDANWGLGESVVSGIATPDHFVVDKTSGDAIAQRLGAKQLSVHIAPGGGTRAVAHARQADFCLAAPQLRQLCSAMLRLEQACGHPVDVEWAYAGGQLFMLQVRPVTRYVPLPAAMLTAPGARRALYMDAALSKGMTSNTPISAMGLDWFSRDIAHMLAQCGDRRALDVQRPESMLYLGGGRMYLNLSAMLWFASPQRLAAGNAPTDQLMAETLAAIDSARYRCERRPALRPFLRMLPPTLWRLRRPLWRTLRTIAAPESTERIYATQTRAFEEDCRTRSDGTLGPGQIQERHAGPAFTHIIDVDLPALGAGVLAAAAVKRLAGRGAQGQSLAARLTRGIGGNLVVDMGMQIYRMARQLGTAAFDDLDALAGRVRRRELPADFLHSWDAFMRVYGCRGPGEMDLASPRYGDDPRLLLRQMSFVAGSSASFDPQAAHRELAVQRAHALEELAARLGPLRRRLLRHADKLLALFGGARDTPKHHYLMVQYAARQRLLAEGGRLARAGRLDRAEQIFGLTLDDLAAAAADPALDLRERHARGTAFEQVLNDHVRQFPAVIDSRGRILRPAARPARPGEAAGLAIAPGVARGRVTVLRDAHEKKVSPGEILVAYTTDPGWTPLFINAAAIILEVGGVLQHGAVVAREYGKPCVAGIEDVLGRFADGQLVEVDGDAGVVRMLGEGGTAPPS